MRVSRIQVRHLILALACLAVLVSGTASASVRIGIGFGTTFGPHHYHHHGWHGGWYAGPHYYYDPWWDPYPVVVVPPVVVRERRVIVEEYKPAPPAPPRIEKTEPLSEKQQQTKSESLKVLRIGDELSRLQAVEDLEPFARDSHVRTTLEKSLSNDRDPLIRKAVADLFGRLKDPKTLPALKQAYAEDEDRDVRQAAYKAIVMMEGYAGV
jgi:hypothetical protein